MAKNVKVTLDRTVEQLETGGIAQVMTGGEDEVGNTFRVGDQMYKVVKSKDKDAYWLVAIIETPVTLSRA